MDIFRLVLRLQVLKTVFIAKVMEDFTVIRGRDIGLEYMDKVSTLSTVYELGPTERSAMDRARVSDHLGDRQLAFRLITSAQM